jgi:gluconokinase
MPGETVDMPGETVGMPARTAEGNLVPVLVVMGVAGSGKSTVGRLLAERLGLTFEEGDDLHPRTNVDKMHAGIPLTDEDRWPWLDRVASWVDGRIRAGEGGVIACSALKRAYRDRIAPHGGVVFVHLVVDSPKLAHRLAHRAGHYMPSSLLASQLDALEEPGPDERALSVDASKPAEAVVEQIVAQLSTWPGVRFCLPPGRPLG